VGLVLWVVIILVLLIPLLAIVLDSQVGQALANRISGSTTRDEDARIAERTQALEDSVLYLTQAVENLEEEAAFVRSLLEDADRGELPRHLEPGE